MDGLELKALQAPIKERYKKDPQAAELKDAKLTAEGDLDFRGTLGVAKDAPVVMQTLRNAPPVVVTR